ncbi:MAG TPA: DUF1465 family protein [Caulobacteraceae bacterium]|nr:DUF1465 family protein [Caulobacteraceae bacterium]
MTDRMARALDVRAELICDFARSALFSHTFAEGMKLVDETAAYLDGAGRRESKLLSRSAALAYAAESMRLTTRLMQMASWLLVQRAVSEGEMSPEAACAPNYRLAEEPASGDPSPGLPATMRSLLARSTTLFGRVRHLDRRVYGEESGTQQAHPILEQIEKLRGAFETG